MMAAFGSLAILSAAFADEPNKWKIGGYLDFYYQVNFNRPSHRTDVFGRQYDIKHNSFSLAAVGVNISGNPIPESKLGVTLQLIAGKNAEINNLAEPGGKDNYRYIQQAFVSYPITEQGLTVDLGKFLTWIGYEGAVSGDNDHYGRSLLFTYAEPLYHTGLRVAGPIGKGVTGGLYLVNGWNEVENSNGQLSYGASLGFNPVTPLFVGLNYFGGTEGGSDSGGGIAFPTNGKRNVSLFDVVVTYNATDKLKLGFNADFGKASTIGRSTDGEWKGAAGYIKYQFTPEFSLAGRYESFSDYDGLRLGTDARITSFAITGDYKVDKAITLRLEYRQDRSNRSFWASDDGTKKSGSTLSASAFVRF
jgi:hypothetical protein